MGLTSLVGTFELKGRYWRLPSRDFLLKFDIISLVPEDDNY